MSPFLAPCLQGHTHPILLIRLVSPQLFPPNYCVIYISILSMVCLLPKQCRYHSNMNFLFGRFWSVLPTAVSPEASPGLSTQQRFIVTVRTTNKGVRCRLRLAEVWGTEGPRAPRGWEDGSFCVFVKFFSSHFPSLDGCSVSHPTQYRKPACLLSP